MPIKIQSDLPARSVLENENIFVMTDERANIQDIRPLKIAIVNLMPTKIATETQLLRLLGNTPLQIEISLVHMEAHQSKNTGEEHLEKFYITSAEALNQKFDGMIITGAPVEQIPFEDVDYWEDLCKIMDYAEKNVFCTLYICWCCVFDFATIIRVNTCKFIYCDSIEWFPWCEHCCKITLNSLVVFNVIIQASCF